MRTRVSVTETIEAPAAVVYGLLSSLPRMGEWSPESTGGRWLPGGGPHVGGRFIGRNRTGKRSWTTLTTVTAAAPDSRFAFRVTAPIVHIAKWEYLIEPIPGGCRVEETFSDLRVPAIQRVSTLRTGIADRAAFNTLSMTRTLAALKLAAESLHAN